VDARSVSSPTFVIAQQYRLPTGPESLHHVDLYRLESESELESIGFYDMLADGQVLAVEWADRFPGALGSEVLSLEFEGPTPEEEDAATQGVPWRGRHVKATAHGDRAESVLADWATRVDGRRPLSGGRAISSPEMRVLMVLLFALGLFGLGRVDAFSETPTCPRLVEIEADHLGTLRAGCARPRAADSAPISGIARLLDGQGIPLNEASVSLLQQLPEIGPSRAEAIVRARVRLPFEAVQDLERVSGIGPKTRQKIERWVVVDRPVHESANPDLKDREDG
jgi:competence ComEA-like helix-hairpin-helix protein